MAFPSQLDYDPYENAHGRAVHRRMLIPSTAGEGFGMDWYDAAGDYFKRTWPHDSRLSVLPAEWQRELVALMLVNREVNNGGYVQFFANRGREAYEYASRALKIIGARRMAEIVDACQALIDEHSPAAGESSEDRAALLPNEIIGRDGQTVKEPGSVLPDSVLARVSELSYEFMDYPEDVGDLAQAHYGPLIEGDKHAEPRSWPTDVTQNEDPEAG